MNRIEGLFRSKRENILSVYFTAGYPSLNTIEEIILSLGRNGADMIEIGIPYSDPLADGEVIQETSKVAINNGMTISELFFRLKDIRKRSSIPLLLMGYMNPVIRFGFERFCMGASAAGIDGLIIPDLPLHEYRDEYMKTTEKYGLKNIFLITPDTSEKRIREIDNLSNGFIYLVSSASVTGKRQGFSSKQVEYFERISGMKLKNPVLAGFGIHDRKTKEQVFRHLNGAIIGSAYLRSLQKGKSIEESTREFMDSLDITAPPPAGQ